MIVGRVSGRRTNYYIFSVYRKPEMDNAIYDCLLDKMQAIQECDRKSSFIFVGDLNVHHVAWGSPTTSEHD